MNQVNSSALLQSSLVDIFEYISRAWALYAESCRIERDFLNIFSPKHVQYFLIMIYIDIYNSNCIHFIFSFSMMQMWLFVRVCTMHNQEPHENNLFILLARWAVCAFNIWLREDFLIDFRAFSSSLRIHVNGTILIHLTGRAQNQQRKEKLCRRRLA